MKRKRLKYGAWGTHCVYCKKRIQKDKRSAVNAALCKHCMAVYCPTKEDVDRMLEKEPLP